MAIISERKVTISTELSDSEESNNSDNESPSQNTQSNSDESDTGQDIEGNATTNEAWADSIAKILKTNKPKGKKTIVLSKAKKLNEIKKPKVKPAGYQIETAEGDVKEEKIEIDDTEEQSDEPKRKRRKDLPKLRVKPNILEKDRERTLQKIATKGVVQLFNAVRIQQKDINKKLEEAGPLDIRKEKVMKNIDKRAFLDILMGDKSKSTNVDSIETETKKKDKQVSSTQNNPNGSWNVLRDDFMMSAKMKDWDKELEETENADEMEVEDEVESE